MADREDGGPYYQVGRFWWAGRVPLRAPVTMEDVIVDELLLSERGSLFVRYFIVGEGEQCQYAFSDPLLTTTTLLSIWELIEAVF